MEWGIRLIQVDLEKKKITYLDSIFVFRALCMELYDENRVLVNGDYILNSTERKVDRFPFEYERWSIIMNKISSNVFLLKSDEGYDLLDTNDF